MRIDKQTRIGIILFLFPALLLFVMFYIIPIFYLIVGSFFEWDGISVPKFNFFMNYKGVIVDSVFRKSIKNNIIWAFAAGGIQVPLALVVALILSKHFRGWKVLRTIYFLPQVISGVAIAALWSAIYNSEYGLLNGIINLLSGKNIKVNWLGNPDTAFGSILIYGLFYIGYYLVIILAGIALIDQEYFDAARLDGASEMKMHFYVTIPMIRNSIYTAVMLAMIYGLRTFEQVYLLTNGGPANKTSVLVLYIHNEMRNYNYGFANAGSVLLLVLGILIIYPVKKIIGIKHREGV